MIGYRDYRDVCTTVRERKMDRVEEGKEKKRKKKHNYVSSTS